MLNFDAARKIGIAACIDKLGRDFVMANRGRAAFAVGRNDSDMFCFVGIDPEGRKSDSDLLVLDGGLPFSHRVSCNVSLVDGEIKFIEDEVTSCSQN